MRVWPALLIPVAAALFAALGPPNLMLPNSVGLNAAALPIAQVMPRLVLLGSVAPVAAARLLR